MTSESEEAPLKVLMLPWLGYGHLSSFLELSKKLSKKSFQIFLCSTPINLSSIKTKTSQLPSLQLIPLSLPSSPQLPPHFHTTNSLPPHLHKPLSLAFNSSRPAFSNILHHLKPHLLIYDVFMPWVPELALAENIPAVIFRSSGAAATSYFYTYFKLQGKGPLPYEFPGIYLREAEIRKMIASAPLDTDAGEDPVYSCVEKSVDIVLVKSCRALEGKYVDFVSKLLGKKLVTVGPLAKSGEEEEEGGLEILEWLGQRDEGSTVFVSFGSENYLFGKKLEELAYGLELSGVSFVWVVRFPNEGKKVNLEEVLPEGYAERVEGRGLVVEGWAPQAKILGHGSVCGFVSHCGWGSVTQSLSYGVPVIGMPLNFDQPLNARLVVELGAGLEVLKDEELEFERGEVARVIKEVVGEKSGEGFRRRAKELSEEIRVREEEEICGVVEELRKICNKNLGV